LEIVMGFKESTIL